MIKMNLLLLLVLVVSGMFLVHAQHENRLLFTSIANETSLNAKLETERKRLLLARQALVTPTRVAVDARKVLDMRVPSLGVIEYIPRDEDELRHFEAQIPGNVRFINEPGDGL